MYPINIDELKSWDVDLTRAQRRIDEDLWLQIAHQKELKPVVESYSPDLIKLRQSLIPEWGAILESLGLKKHVEHETKVYSNASFNNIIRVAQSIARDENKNNVDTSIINKSWKLFTENADALINNPIIQHQANVVIPEMHESAKFNAIRAELSVNLLDIKNYLIMLKMILEIYRN